ncbi:MAG: tripartite tricarboxylate transporter permease [Methanocorpusculum sp.]|jgi:putative membrane protein|nr:tripartite tricarboxylate transporter permease [Methanocorpusculum sp.]HJJ62379.1 tripartite tricarboxylate transporter permease [Methanocorpusculum sp.]HJJ67633.1 tripartite tricarboxylate transporter permease [Methanocorpusculum sp.]HJJ73148.1 tripartite tricarboxylate transporter permease [Methanocorpusculum sp.]
MLSLLLGTLAGVILGTLSGLIPGLHTNTFAAVISAASVPLAMVFGAEGICCLLVSCMIVHTFLDAVPSTFIGVPDADTVLSVLPAHRLYLSGKGEEAVRLSALGSLWGFVYAMPLFAAFYFVLPMFQNEIDWAIGLVILTAAGLLIVFSKTPFWALLMFLASGLLGVFSMRFSYFSFGVFGAGEVLLPLLTGLFGIPVLLHALRAEPAYAEQSFSGLFVSRKDTVWNTIKGTFAGAIVGWLPGFSSGTANALLAFHRSGDYESNPRGYLLSTSAANTANAVLGLAALYAVGRMRSGALAAVAEFPLPNIFMLLAAAGASAAAAYMLTVLFAKTGKYIAKVNQKMLSASVLIFLIILTAVFCGPFGMMILILSTAVGWIPGKLGFPRLYCMGAVMLPVMLFSFGLLQL